MKITIKNLQKKISFHPQDIRKTILNTLSLDGIKKSGEINVFLVDNTRIRELNLKHFGKDNPTDVIAFDSSEPKISDKLLADIFISTEAALSNCRIYKTSVEQELCLYVIHGVLHVLGYDDKKRKDKSIMRKKEKSLLKILNLSN